MGRAGPLAPAARHRAGRQWSKPEVFSWRGQLYEWAMGLEACVDSTTPALVTQTPEVRDVAALVAGQANWGMMERPRSSKLASVGFVPASPVLADHDRWYS